MPYRRLRFRATAANQHLHYRNHPSICLLTYIQIRYLPLGRWYGLILTLLEERLAAAAPFLGLVHLIGGGTCLHRHHVVVAMDLTAHAGSRLLVSELASSLCVVVVREVIVVPEAVVVWN